MKFIASIVLVLSVLFASSASAQLPTGNNVKDAWRQGSFDGLRIYYSYYSPKPEDFACRIDYFHDGRIRLLVSEGHTRTAESRLTGTTVWYNLKPTTVTQQTGYELVRTSFQLFFEREYIRRPVILSEDLFTKRCVEHLSDLFEQIPEAEVKMFKDQYGAVFGVE